MPEKRSILTFLCIKYPDLIQMIRRSKYIYALEHCDTMIVSTVSVHSRRGETLDTTESVSSGKRLFKQTAGSLPTAN